jgi:AraC family transcriptional regulator
MLLQTFESSSSVDAFETLPTHDHVVVLMLQGEYEIESFSSGAWKRAAYRPGVGGMTAALNTSRLRWHSHNPGLSRTLHLYIPQAYFDEATEEYRRAGVGKKREPPDALLFSDPVILSVAKSLSDGLHQGLPDLYADAASRFLATLLLSKHNRWSDETLNLNPGSELTDRRLLRVLDFMKHHFMDSITLDQLAAEAGISRFHFVRIFKKKLGSAPHRYLVQLRMDHARALLADTDLSISQVATACGYVHSGHFASTFQRQFSVSPAAYRRSL